MKLKGVGADKNEVRLWTGSTTYSSEAVVEESKAQVQTKREGSGLRGNAEASFPALLVSGHRDWVVPPIPTPDSLFLRAPLWNSTSRNEASW